MSNNAGSATERRRPGRPEEMKDGKRRNVYIDNRSWEVAQKLGNGNASEGIRLAIEKAAHSR